MSLEAGKRATEKREKHLFNNCLTPRTKDQDRISPYNQPEKQMKRIKKNINKGKKLIQNQILPGPKDQDRISPYNQPDKQMKRIKKNINKGKKLIQNQIL